MSEKHTLIRLRRGTSAEWAASLPQPDGEVLKLGEPGYEKDTGKLKIGDGVTGWNNLSYITPDFINIVSSGAIADLTLSQQDQIVEGTIVLTSDGVRWVYTGSGNKLLEASYIQLSDISPAWIQITSKPASLVGLAEILTSSSGDFILATGNNTYQVVNFAESVDDRVGNGLMVAGNGISLNYNDSANTLTVTCTLEEVLRASSLVTTVFNKTGSPIPKFSVVYIDGGQGDQPTINLASASGEASSSKTYGITSETIGNMSSGKVIVYGALTGINTDQFNPTAPSGNVNGVTLYLSPSTPGAVTTTKPSAPNHMVSVGTIVRTHQNQGVVEVKIQNGFELQELHNVAVSGVTNGQFLQYDSGNQLWVPTSSGNFTTLQVNGTGVIIGTAGSVDNAILRADGTGGRTLQSSDISIADASTSTQNNVAIINQHSGQANSALVLTPKGSGAFIVGPSPDGTSVGGNPRGSGAICIQTSRSAATQVASTTDSIAIGNRSTSSSSIGESIAIGAASSATGQYATCVGGRAVASNTYSCAFGHDSDATGQSGSVALGDRTLASQTSSIAIGTQSQATGDYAIAIGAQATAAGSRSISIGAFLSHNIVNACGISATPTVRAEFATLPFSAVYWGGTTTDNTANVELNLDNTATNRMVIPANTMIVADLLIAANQAGVANSTAKAMFCKRTVAIRRDNANSTVLVGEVQAIGNDQFLNAPTWSISIDADDTNEALRVRVTGATGETVTWRVTAFYRVV